MKKEKVYIDVISCEDGSELYLLGSYKDKDTKRLWPADICDSGFFTNEEELNSFLEDRASEIDIIEDYR